MKLFYRFRSNALQLWADGLWAIVGSLLGSGGFIHSSKSATATSLGFQMSSRIGLKKMM